MTTNFTTSGAPLATLDNIGKLVNLVRSEKGYRSAWDKGVKAYALDILANFEEWAMFNLSNSEPLPVINERTALNGAKDWEQYAFGGCGLVYDAYIAERLCTPAQMRKLLGTDVNWLGLESVALLQAWRLIARLVPAL